ncbi:MAG TPA: hypothetical protein VF739_11800 [Ktedonobacterales bacterium]
MPHDTFDVYATIIKDTNEMNARRRQLDSLYVTLITFILTGEAFVAFYSAFNNWLLVFVTIGISIVGSAVTARWRDGVRNLDKILNFRYEYLRKLEAEQEMINLGATFYTQEFNINYKPHEDQHSHQDKRFRTVTNRLQWTFMAVFIVVPLLLLSLTAVETIPFVHSFIPSQALPFIRPLVSPPKP